MAARQLADTAETRAELGRILLGMSPDRLESFVLRWDEDDRPLILDVYERARAEIHQQGWRTDPFTMARHLEGEAFADYRFSQFLAQRFRAAVTGESPFQVWNLPAQLGKTQVVRRCIAWALDRDPSLPIILACYGDDLAVNSARFVRDYGIAHADQLRYRLRSDASKVGEWLTTEGGGLKATGMGGALSGFPAGGVFLDDPHKNWQEAHSVAAQEEAWNLYRSVLRLRLRMAGWFILVTVRWCDGDLTDRILKEAKEIGERWEHVKLPMIARDNDPLGRAPGEVLEPRRYDLAAAEARAKAIGPYLAAAMEGQDPAPLEGGMIKRAWWKIDAVMPERYDEQITSWDMKLKDVARRGDFVAGQVWGRTGGHMWGIDAIRGQWDFLTTKAAVALMQVRYPQIRRHVIENTGNGPEVMRDLRAGHKPSPGGALFVLPDEVADELGMTGEERGAVEAVMRRGMAGLEEHNPRGDKTIRALSMAGPLRAGDVHLRDAPFAYSLIGEAAQFPRSGVPDDQVDAWSQAMSILTGYDGTTSVVSAASTSLGRPQAGSAVPARRQLHRPTR